MDHSESPLSVYSIAVEQDDDQTTDFIHNYHTETNNEHDDKDTQSDDLPDSYKIPADIDDALLHYDCNRFGKPVLADLEMTDKVECSCCNQIKQENLPMNTPTEQLIFFGPAIPLLFQMSKYLILLSIAYLPASIYLQTRIVQTHCHRQTIDNPGIYCPASLEDLIPHRQANDAIFVSAIVAVYKLLVSIVILVIYYQDQFRLAKMIKDKHISAADFTVMVSGLWPTQASLEYLRSILTTNNGQPPQIVKVCIATVDSALKETLTAVQDQLEIAKRIESNLKSCESAWKVKYYEKLKIKSLKKAADINDNWPEGSNRSLKHSVAFVTLQTRKEAASIPLTSLSSWICYQCCSCVRRRRKHYISRAPYPNEVNWRSIGISPKKRCCSLFYVGMIRLLCIVMTFAVQFTFRAALPFLIKNVSSKNKWDLGLVFNTYPIISSLATVLMNKVMILVAHLLVEKEYHMSETQKLKSLTKKCFELQLTNSVFGIFLGSFSHLRLDPNQKINVGLSLVMTMIWQMIMSPWLDAFPISYLYKKIIPRYLALRRQKQGKIYDITQKELNALFDPPSIKMHTRYASYLRSIAILMIYYNFAPIASLLLLGYLIHQFWVDKYMMLRRNKKTVRISEDVAYMAGEWLVPLLIFNAVVAWIDVVESDLIADRNETRTKIKNISLPIMIPLSVLISMIPMRRMISNRMQLVADKSSDRDSQSDGKRVGLRSDVKITDDTPYEHVWTDLVDDYDRLNPISKYLAIDHWKTARDQRIIEKYKHDQVE